LTIRFTLLDVEPFKLREFKVSLKFPRAERTQWHARDAHKSVADDFGFRKLIVRPQAIVRAKSIAQGMTCGVKK
jgi:hypothetical protein